MHYLRTIEEVVKVDQHYEELKHKDQEVRVVNHNRAVLIHHLKMKMIQVRTNPTKKAKMWSAQCNKTVHRKSIPKKNTTKKISTQMSKKKLKKNRKQTNRSSLW